MKPHVTHSDSFEFLSLSFHPTETLKCKAKRTISSLWHCVLLTLFVMGLPAFALAVIDLIPRLIAR